MANNERKKKTYSNANSGNNRKPEQEWFACWKQKISFFHLVLYADWRYVHRVTHEWKPISIRNEMDIIVARQSFGESTCCARFYYASCVPFDYCSCWLFRPIPSRSMLVWLLLLYSERFRAFANKCRYLRWSDSDIVPRGLTFILIILV